MINIKVIDPNKFYNLNEKEKEKYIQNIREIIEKSNNKLIKRMNNIVKRNVKNYISDFYVHDIYLIEKYSGPFLWMTRSSGTDFIPLENLSESLLTWYNYIKYINKNFYFYNGKTLRKITCEEMDKIMNKYKLKAAI